MRRRVHRMIGLTTAAILFAASLARAQDAPVSLGLPQVPKFELQAPASEQPKDEIPVSPNTGMPRLQHVENGGSVGMADLAGASGETIDPRYVGNSMHPDDPGIWEMWRTDTGVELHRLVQDYKNFYLSENLLYVGVAIAVAAPIANTNADQSIRNWYQHMAGHSNTLNSAATVFRDVGEVGYAIPFYATFALAEYFFPDCATLDTLGDFSWRSLRALAVGAPTIGILQYGLGSGRPNDVDDSHWRLSQFHSGASGHAFVGAVPFLTAAAMTDNPYLQTAFFVGSLGPAWSRIQTDDHYFSQALLGWSIAFLSVQSVNLTECQAHNMRIVPVDIPKGVGLGVEIKY